MKYMQNTRISNPTQNKPLKLICGNVYASLKLRYLLLKKFSTVVIAITSRFAINTFMMFINMLREIKPTIMLTRYKNKYLGNVCRYDDLLLNVNFLFRINPSVKPLRYPVALLNNGFN